MKNDSRKKKYTSKKIPLNGKTEAQKFERNIDWKHITHAGRNLAFENIATLAVNL